MKLTEAQQAYMEVLYKVGKPTKDKAYPIKPYPGIVIKTVPQDSDEFPYDIYDRWGVITNVKGDDIDVYFLEFDATIPMSWKKNVKWPIADKETIWMDRPGKSHIDQINALLKKVK